MSDGKFLYELMSPVDYENICNKVLSTRKENEDESITYDEIEYSVGGVVYKVQGTHYPVQDVIASASSKCKDCSSKGYIITNVTKERLPDPSGFLVLEDEPESGSSKESTTWRILTPCECAVKNVIRANGSLFTIDTRCVFVDLSFTSQQNIIEG